MASFDVDEQLARLKRDYPFPSGQGNFTDAKVIDLFNDVIRDYIAPLVISYKEEFVTYYADQTLSASTIRYEIPNRAIGNKVRKIEIIDSSGNVVVDRRAELAGKNGYYYSGAYVYFNSNYLAGIAGNTLRIYYHRILNKLVPSGTDSSGVSVAYTLYGTNVNVRYATASTATTITLNGSSIPSTFVANAYVDIISQDNPYQVKGRIKIVSTSGQVLTVEAHTSITIDDNDWVCLEGWTPVPNLPQDFHGLIIAKTAERIAAKIGDTGRYQIASADYQNLVTSLATIMKNRDEGNLVSIRAPRDSIL